MPPDNSHAERKIAKRKAAALIDKIPWALGYGVAQYDWFGGLRRDAYARTESAKLVASLAGIGEIEAAQLLADALARRASLKVQS